MTSQERREQINKKLEIYDDATIGKAYKDICESCANGNFNGRETSGFWLVKLMLGEE